VFPTDSGARRFRDAENRKEQVGVRLTMTDPISVRPGEPTDFDPIVAQYGATGVTPWDPFTDPERLAGIPLDGLLVAEKDGAYAGFLYWFEGRHPWFDRGADRYAALHELRVLPEYEGWGVSRHLVNRFVEEVRERGIPLVYAATAETNTAAQQLYESGGFRPFLRTTHYRWYR